MTLNYSDIINLATQGFRNIQNALSSISEDSGVSPVSTSTSNSVDTHSGNITPAAMVTAINNLATIKKSNTNTNTVTDTGTYIHGRVAYRGSVNVTDTIGFSGASATLTKTLPAGYYSGITINASGTMGNGSVTISGAGLSKGTLDSDASSVFIPTDVVNKSGTSTSGYSYAKINRAAVTATTNNGYITSANITNNISGTVAGYVKIPNATFNTLTKPTIKLDSTFVQSVKEGSSTAESQLTNDDIVLKSGDAPNTPYYKFVLTPTTTTTSNGSLTVKTDGYTKSGAGSTSIGVTTGQVLTQTLYMPKSITGSPTTINTSYTATGVGYNQMVKISKGYYPSDRYVKNSISSGSVTITETINRTITKYYTYNGSAYTNSDKEILLTSTGSLTDIHRNYYMVTARAKFDRTVNGGYVLDGNVTGGGTYSYNYGYIPEIKASIAMSQKNNTNASANYSLDNTPGTILTPSQGVSLIETTKNKTGIVTAQPTSGTAGSDYWRIQSTAVQTGTATAVASINSNENSFSAGYMGAASLISNSEFSIAPVLTASGNHTIYLKKAAVSLTATSNATNNTVTLAAPSIAKSNGGNINSYVTSPSTSAPSGYSYYITVKANKPADQSVVVTPKAKTSQGGYLPYSTAFLAAPTVGTNTLTVTTKGQESAGYYIGVQSGVAHNGYVTINGWIPTTTQVYTTTYDSTEQCVDFIFNN